MPWRSDFSKCFWVDPNWVGFSGYPEDHHEQGSIPVDEGPAHVSSHYPTQTATPTDIGRPIGAAVIVVRDRTGFRYERQVGLDDFVTVRDAGQLLRLPVMTVSRWIKQRRIRSRKQNGFSVIRLREVLRIAQARNGPVTLGSHLKIVG
jgi:hypothetical protein